MGERCLLSQKEMPRPGLVRLALAGKISNAEGARSLGLSVRQFQRLKVRYRRSGPAGLVHRSRGQSSPRGLKNELRERIADLIRTKYSELNDCHLTEKLREVEEILVSRESVRRLRLGMKRRAKRRRKSPQHRGRRLRQAREGTWVQIDGSPHDWLQGRGAPMTLVGGVDDATGKTVGATFRPEEDVHGYATVFAQIFRRYGLPVAFYGDGTSILVRNDDHWSLAEELQGHQTPPQMGLALKELGIGLIQARSPQAKGRIENRWGTFQDRLVAEMALRGISSLEEANAFLPEFLEDFDRRFAVAPRETVSAWRQPGRAWPLALCCRYQRTVARDNTVLLLGGRNSHPPPRILQIPPGPGQRSYAGCKVEVRELLDGRSIVHYRGRILLTEKAPEGSFQLIPRHAGHRLPLQPECKPTQRKKPAQSKPIRKTTKGRKTPDPDHPWRNWQPTFCKTPTRRQSRGDIFSLQLP
jgi:hypothetical protein